MKNFPDSPPHEVHKLSAIEALEALPPVRRAPAARHAVRLLEEAIADSRKLPGAYEILAQFGELERTRNGYKCIDASALVNRCKRVRDAIMPHTFE
jgi:hypothetical protein